MKNIQIKQMKQAEATEIANNWKYPTPYNFYDMTEDEEDYNEIVNERKDNYFSVKQEEEILGFFCIFPKEDTSKNNIELGIGMRPDLTGLGLGKEFIQLVINYLNKKYKFPTIWLSVAKFNQRAIKVYQRVGFQFVREIKQQTNGDEYSFVVMNNKEMENYE